MELRDFNVGDWVCRMPKKNQTSGFDYKPHEIVAKNDKCVVFIVHQNYGCNQYGECEIRVFLLRDEWEKQYKDWELFPIEEIKQSVKRLKEYGCKIAELTKLEEDELEQYGNKLEKGQLVKTCDNRYGFVKKVDEHSCKFLKRRDYQIQFPDGVGIFRRDEFEAINNPIT